MAALSMREMVFVMLAAMAVFSAGPAAFAAAGDVFVVPRVPVQATADTARDAKAAAQRDGRRRAMDILLRRIMPEVDWVYLPNLSLMQPAQASDSVDGKRAIVLTDAELEVLESGFEVYGEKSSSTVYRAYITYRFKPADVRRLLQSARLPYSETQTRTALVLPVLQTDSDVYLWEQNNPWMATWKARPYTHELTPMAAPLGDLDDSRLITARGALDVDAPQLAAIAAHYGVSQVIVAHARLRQDNGRDNISIRLINGFSEATKATTLEDIIEDAVDYSANGAIGVASGTELNFSAEIGEVLASSFVSDASGNFPALAEKGIDASIAKYAGTWKEKTLIDHSTERLLPVSVFFNSVDEWSRIRTGLIATPLVGSVQVSSMSKRGAEMDIKVFGDPNRLQVTMENQGVVFWSEGGDRWFLATPNLATQIQGAKFLKPRRRGLFGENDGDDDVGRVYPTSSDEAEAGGSKIERRF